MVVADSENYAPQSTSFETKEKVLPAGGTLPVGHLYTEHLAPAFPLDADGHEHRSRADHSIFPHFLIPRIEDHIGILAIELAAGKATQLLVELLVDLTDRTRAKTVPAEFLADRFDFRVETPWIYICVKAATNAFSLR